MCLCFLFLEDIVRERENKHIKLEGLKYGVFFLSMVFKELESSLKVHISLIAIW